MRKGYGSPSVCVYACEVATLALEADGGSPTLNSWVWVWF